MEHQTTTLASAAGTSKKHTRSRGRSKKAADPYASSYGIVPFKMFLRGRPWTSTRDLGEAMVGKHVLLFGKVLSVRPLGNSTGPSWCFSTPWPRARCGAWSSPAPTRG